MFDNFVFSDNRAVYEIMWRNVIEPERPQMILWCMRIAGWILKASNTHSEYVILANFPQKQWLNERASVLRSTYIACFCFWIHIFLCKNSFCDGPISGPRCPKSVCKHDSQTRNTKNHLSETADHRTYYFILRFFSKHKAFRSPLVRSNNMKYSGLNPRKWSTDACVVSKLWQSLCRRCLLTTYSFWTCACIPMVFVMSGNIAGDYCSEVFSVLFVIMVWIF
jgi:hypothetical protein